MTRLAIATRLETGAWGGLFSRTVAAVWAPYAARQLVRPARVKPGTRVLCVGGATLGGSGKTRVAIASARELARSGARVVLIGHAYRSRLRTARVVTPDDTIEDVGDEALLCARALGGQARVVAGPDRQGAIDHAMLLSPDVLVLDGPLRISNVAPGDMLSLLAVDAVEPWGSGRVPPAGDLRASPEDLIRSADHIIPVNRALTTMTWREGPHGTAEGGEAGLKKNSLSGMGYGAKPHDERHSVGVFTALARPHRLQDAVVARGFRVVEWVSIADHGPLTVAARSRLMHSIGIDGWIATDKCALHLRDVRLPVPLAILSSNIDLPVSIREALWKWAKRLHGMP